MRDMFERAAVACAAAAVLLAVGGAFGASAADTYEIGVNRRASEILPADVIKGPHYQIDEKVVTYGFMHTYTVTSDYGTFKVTGDFALQKLLNEIHVIGELKKVQNTDAYAQAVVHAAKSPLRLGKNLIEDPVDTLNGLPRGLFQIVENVGTAATEEQDPSEDSRVKQMLFVSSWKRDFCAEYGCDVYSSNKVLQEELNRMGWAAALGGLTISGVSMATTGTASTVFSAVRMSDQMDQALKEEPPARLRIINDGKLEAMGVSPELRKRFLDHPAFTPRHDTIITAALESLDGARGRDRFIELALAAQDEVGANYFQNVAEILSGYHRKVSPIAEVQVMLGVSIAQAKNGEAVMAFAWDHGVYEKAVGPRMDYFSKNFHPAGFKGGLDVWTTGTISPKLREKAASHGFRVTEEVDKKVGFTL